MRPPGNPNLEDVIGRDTPEGSNGEQAAEVVRNGRSGAEGGVGKPLCVDPSTSNVEEEKKPRRGALSAGVSRVEAGPSRSPKETSIPGEMPSSHRSVGAAGRTKTPRATVANGKCRGRTGEGQRACSPCRDALKGRRTPRAVSETYQVAENG